MAKKFKKKKPIDVIFDWCKINKCSYADFQQMESLGYLKVMRSVTMDLYIKIIDPYFVEYFLRDRRVAN